MEAQWQCFLGVISRCFHSAGENRSLFIILMSNARDLSGPGLHGLFADSGSKMPSYDSRYSMKPHGIEGSFGHQ